MLIKSSYQLWLHGAMDVTCACYVFVHDHTRSGLEMKSKWTQSEIEVASCQCACAESSWVHMGKWLWPWPHERTAHSFLKHVSSVCTCMIMRDSLIQAWVQWSWGIPSSRQWFPHPHLGFHEGFPHPSSWEIPSAKNRPSPSQWHACMIQYSYIYFFISI